MRAVFRLLSLIALVVAVIAGVVDAVQSVAANAVVTTPLGAAWRDASPATLTGVEQWAHSSLPTVLRDASMGFVLDQPAWAVFLALSFLFYVIGYRRRRPASRFTRR